MKKRIESEHIVDQRQFPLAKTPEERDMQLALLATDAIERRIRNGEASAQELLFYAKKGGRRDKIEEEILENNRKLIEAKTLQIEESRKTQERYQEVIDAIKRYSGVEDDAYEEDVY